MKTLSRQRKSELRTALFYVASPLTLVILWELAVRLALVDFRFFPPPSAILWRLYELALSGELANHALVSARRVILGFLLGAVPALVLGMWMGVSRVFHMVMNPLVALLYPIPKTAILPLLMLVFGIGDASKVVAIGIGSFFLVLINTYHGVSGISRIYFDVCSVFGVSTLDRYRRVVIPGALPGIFTGAKLAMGYSVVLMVAAEFVGATSGIGHLIWQTWESFDIRGMYAGLVVVSLMGYFATLLVDQLQKWMIPWRPVTAGSFLESES